MATYLGTHGSKIQTYSTDPTYPNTGEVWYNSTSNTIKMEATTTAGSWATGGALNQFRDQAAGSGTVTSTLVFGGGPPNQDKTESYNGSNWTEVNDLNTARRGIAGAGADNTSALAFAGGAPGKNNTESWNGTNWTAVNTLNTARYFAGGTGIITAAICYGGTGGSSATETWNGTNWTTVNSLNTGRDAPGSAGIQTSAVAFGGTTPSVTNKTELWNGTNWTEVNVLNTARVGAGGAGASNTSAIAFGGGVPYPSAPPPTVPSANTEEWNGTNWTETTNMSTARAYIAGSGTKTLALASGGSDKTNTEEWTGAGAPVVKTISTD
jgi:hypothetical protein